MPSSRYVKIGGLAPADVLSADDRVHVSRAIGVSVYATLAQIAATVEGASVPMQLTRVAGEALGGHRIVRLNEAGEAIYADSTTIADASVVLGMTVGAAESGADAVIQTEGELVEPSWNWAADLPIFLGMGGQLTQTAPSSGFVLQVAVPTGTDRVFIRIGPPILAEE